ncbi:hypothetical protein [Methanobrevibacter sp.]|uniref:hypothetical protein n=1 Tax=Methanobrevibacter sp. TaxID=66852 RepID=UPI003864A700
MLDDKGYFYIIDAILAVMLLLMVFLVINATISIPSPDYSYEIHDFKTAQDIMEILSGKVNFTDQTFLAEISQVLQKGENSKESVREVSKLCKEKLGSYGLKNYKFSENNVLKGKVLASSGDYSKAGDVSVATRNYGDYSYSLSTW